MSGEPIQFSREVVVAQLVARSSLRRGLVVIAFCLIAYGLVTYLAIRRLDLPDSLWLTVVVLPLIAAFVATRQLQWSILASHGLRCPFCNHLLATERRWWSSPQPFCKACGKLAILPNSILDFAKTH